MAAKPERRFKVVADNRKARFNYEIGETFEAGIVLTGSEVKSLRAGQATIAEVLCRRARRRDLADQFQHPGIQQAGRFNHAPKRPRKLLLHMRQINKLAGAVEREGMTVVPLKLYFNEQGPRQGRDRARQGQEAARQARDAQETLVGARARAADAAEGLI